MNWTNIINISSVVTIFGFIVTLATLIFLFYQCQILKSSLRTQSFQNLFSNMINIDIYFANNPSAKLYVYNEGNDLPQSTNFPEYIQAMSACELVLDHFEEVFGCKNVMSREMWLGWSGDVNEDVISPLASSGATVEAKIEVNKMEA